MKNLLFLFLALGLFTFASCGDDDSTDEVTLEYHAHIMSPEDMSEFHKGATLSIEVTFEEHNSEPVHHINVRIYRKDDPTAEVYNAPADAHVHEMSGTHVFKADVELDDDFTGGMHGDYILEAKVWGHDAGLGEVVESVQFHVHPL